MLGRRGLALKNKYMSIKEWRGVHWLQPRAVLNINGKSQGKAV